MAIPELNEEQIEQMISMCGENNAVIQVLPEEAKDGKARYEEGMESLRDINQLAILGLIRDVTEQYMEAMFDLYAKDRRIRYVFEITPAGIAMFTDTTKRSVQ